MTRTLRAAGVELLTGQAADSVRGLMRRTGISLRQPGGRSPFLRRWRTGNYCR